ncbi:MAG: cyclase family protein [Alphaproteobacteria bacterium]
MAGNARWKQRPEGSTWGDWGADDQLGRLNLLTPQKALEGVAEVRAGRTFCLSLPLDLPGGSVLNPRRWPPKLRPTIREQRPLFNYPLEREDARLTDVISDDTVLMCTQYSTQWDSLAHVGSTFDADGDGVAERVYYNGFRADEHVQAPAAGGETSAARSLGVENMAAKCIQGRAVLVDLEKHFGDTRRFVTRADLEGVMKADGVVVEPGDMLCLNTGFGRMLMARDGTPSEHDLHHTYAVLDGRDPTLLDWITDSGIAALIADNYAVEGLPARPPADGGHRHAFLPIHEHCLFKLGLNLGELWYFSELADWLRANGRSRFLLTAPPLRLRGAVGSPASPIATV